MLAIIVDRQGLGHLLQLESLQQWGLTYQEKQALTDKTFLWLFITLEFNFQDNLSSFFQRNGRFLKMGLAPSVLQL
jgi:hypothetical protein